MKRLKIMMLSMAVLAIIGGALAFKAKYSSTYCTLTANFENGAYTYAPLDATKDCIQIGNVKTTDASASGATPVFYTLKPTNVDCSRVTCSTFTYFKGDQP